MSCILKIFDVEIIHRKIKWFSEKQFSYDRIILAQMNTFTTWYILIGIQLWVELIISINYNHWYYQMQTYSIFLYFHIRFCLIIQILRPNIIAWFVILGHCHTCNLHCKVCIFNVHNKIDLIDLYFIHNTCIILGVA